MRVLDEQDRRVTKFLKETLPDETVVVYGWAHDRPYQSCSEKLWGLFWCPCAALRDVFCVNPLKHLSTLFTRQKWVYVGQPNVAMVLTAEALFVFSFRWAVAPWGFLSRTPRGVGLIGDPQRLPLGDGPPARLAVYHKSHFLEAGGHTAFFMLGYSMAHWRSMEALLEVLVERGLVVSDDQ